MRKFGIIGPNPGEIDVIIETIKQPETIERGGLRFLRGSLSGHEVVAVLSGICKVNGAIAAQQLIDFFGISDLILVGVAGAIAPLKIADTVIATEVAHHDVVPSYLMEGVPYLTNEQGYMPCDKNLLSEMKQAFSSQTGVFYGPIVSGEYFVDQAGREGIIENFSPLAVDMETAGAAQAAYLNQVPFIAIRSITDTEEESGLGTFRENFDLSRIRVQELLLDYFRNLTCSK